MKRTLAIALSTLALAATSSAQAQSVYVPQPSFIDYAPLDASQGGSSTGSSSTPVTSRQAWPQPSFLDYVPVQPGGMRIPAAA